MPWFQKESNLSNVCSGVVHHFCVWMVEVIETLLLVACNTTPNTEMMYRTHLKDLNPAVIT